jgi:hypothetical protein
MRLELAIVVTLVHSSLWRREDLFSSVFRFPTLRKTREYESTSGGTGKIRMVSSEAGSLKAGSTSILAIYERRADI